MKKASKILLTFYSIVFTCCTVLIILNPFSVENTEADEEQIIIPVEDSDEYQTLLKRNKTIKDSSDYFLQEKLRLEEAYKTLEQEYKTLEEYACGLESEVEILEQIIESFNEDKDWDYEYTELEVKELGSVMFGEEEGDSFMAAGAGSVVLNRVSRSDFPDKVHDVIYEIIKTKDATYEQYAPRTKKILECVVAGQPIPSTLADVKYVPAWYFDLARFLLENGSIFPKDVVYQAHFKQGKGVYYEKDGEFFCFG